MTEIKTYFILKQSIYDHGVFWIGNDIETGKKKAREFADADRDSHHLWCLYEYEDQCINSFIDHYKADDCDDEYKPKHKLIFSCVK